MSVESEPLRLIQVGLGGWGRSWAAELLKHPKLVRTEAYVDMAPAMLAALRDDTAIAESMCFDSFSEALRSTDADTVLVTTALPHHASVAIEALEAGKDVIVEKPLAPTLAEARRMIDSADAAGRQLVVSQNYRFYPAAQKAAELVRTKALGEVGSVSVSFRKYANTAEPEGWSHYVLPDPLLMDMSVHHFDLMRFVLGREPRSVAAAAWNPSWSRFRDPASAIAQVVFGDDLVVDYRGSWVSTARPTLWSGEWVLECENGTIEWTGRDDSGTTADELVIHHRDGEIENVALPSRPYFDRVGTIAEFAAARRESRMPQTHARDNINTLLLTLGTIAASRAGTVVQLDAVDAASDDTINKSNTKEAL
ncbi:Gfo/Idh/MocA family protein [uncultured Leifsonia sp.]|uniref:Gfo/Idh/MocA family protein n=1 Tax=uncultured Leifsonia sp. TaxID=340359 RepID=UPI0025D23241|nr:Gfo/Idh/MocA family oxidoreductase [uncultured Leifsonia sp.]